MSHLAQLSVAGGKPDVDTVTGLISQAADIIVALTAEIKADVNVNVALDVNAVVAVVLDFLAVSLLAECPRVHH